MTDNELLFRFARERGKGHLRSISSLFPFGREVCFDEQRNAQDAEDVFQDAVMVLLTYITKKDFTLTCTMKTLIFAIARRLWLKQLRDRSISETLTELEIGQQDFVTQWEEVERSERKYDSIPQVPQQDLSALFWIVKRSFSHRQDPGTL
ncbi:MAG: hypothetical protein WDO15_15265 [Bacteroidota bacterium]